MLLFFIMLYDDVDMSNIKVLNRQDNRPNLVNNYNANFSAFLDNIHGSSFHDDIISLKSLQEKLKHIKSESSEKYINDLLYPEKAMHAKIPNVIPFPTSSFHMHNSYTVTPNASGNFMFAWNPFFLDSAGVNTGFLLNTDVGLTGNITQGGIGVANGFTIPSIYTEYRLVSAAVVITPKNSMLNMQGTISLSTTIDPTLATTAIGAVNAGINNYGIFSNIDDAYYNQIAPASHGLRGIYFPLDVTYEQFQTVGIPKYGFAFIGYGQGLQASTPCVRMDFYCNFEATAQATFLQFIPRSIGAPCSTDAKGDAVTKAQKDPIQILNTTDPAKNYRDSLPNSTDLANIIKTVLDNTIKIASTVEAVAPALSKSIIIPPSGVKSSNPLANMGYGVSQVNDVRDTSNIADYIKLLNTVMSTTAKSGGGFGK